MGDNLLNPNTALDELGTSPVQPMLLFPQPARDVLHVRAPEGRAVQAVRVLDMSSRVALANAQRWSGVQTIDMSALPPADYVLEWSDAAG